MFLLNGHHEYCQDKSVSHAVMDEILQSIYYIFLLQTSYSRMEYKPKLFYVSTVNLKGYEKKNDTNY